MRDHHRSLVPLVSGLAFAIQSIKSSFTVTYLTKDKPHVVCTYVCTLLEHEVLYYTQVPGTVRYIQSIGNCLSATDSHFTASTGLASYRVLLHYYIITG